MSCHYTPFTRFLIVIMRTLIFSRKVEGEQRREGIKFTEVTDWGDIKEIFPWFSEEKNTEF